ncbi:right-handed parallel beta-helix repeat-containing protein [Mariniflexile sp. AS56]|uniref:right-handed parallel beta-helix repeat-containing protein n=1 Tax=Mariniflexile sp. AS56 TaxID=3063957 RepID=UPI0026F0A35E|nr:right-handed parallel beta-helix repeat-containing protein [Mariniflexile sp. AS56]MDO7170809.1 hypothetical protein [Mariniflexile sp. AS56]
MKTSTLFLKNMLCFVIGIMTLSLSAQTIINIDNNPGSTTTHQTLQDALDDITTNNITDAVIYVQPSGSTYGNGVIDTPVTIVGRSHSEPGKKSIVSRINPRASNITLKGLEISSCYPTGTGPTAPPYSGLNIFECEINSTFYLGTSSSQAAATYIDGVFVRGCVIQSTLTIYGDTNDVLISNNIFAGNNPINTYNAATTVVTNNVFKYWSSQIIFYNYAPSSTLLLFNNMFIFNYGADANILFPQGDFNLTNNLTYNYSVSGDVNISTSSGGSYLDSFTLANTDPLFKNVDPAVSQSFADNSSYYPYARLEDDLTLQATANGDPLDSPALTGGGGGSEIGLYNNGFNFNVLGNPQGVPTLDVISYDGAVEIGGNINVTIKAKAH